MILMYFILKIFKLKNKQPSIVDGAIKIPLQIKQH